MAKKTAKQIFKILLVEDDKILRDMYVDKLECAGFKMVTAFDAKEGLRLFKKAKPDLVLLDILLPREDGIFFLEKLKGEAKNLPAPVLAFSNYDDPRTKAKALELGVKEYLIKASHNPKELISKIKKYL